MFNLTAVGDTQLVAKLRAIDKSMVKGLLPRVQTLAIKLQGHIITDKLSGQVLNKRSGDLKASIQQKVEQTETAVYGIVYSAGDVKYAKPHEFGFHETVTVHQHMRTMLFGKDVAPFSVGPYSMKMNLPERSFMRSSLADMREEITAGLKAGAVEGAKEGLKS